MHSAVSLDLYPQALYSVSSHFEESLLRHTQLLIVSLARHGYTEVYADLEDGMISTCSLSQVQCSYVGFLYWLFRYDQVESRQ